MALEIVNLLVVFLFLFCFIKRNRVAGETNGDIVDYIVSTYLHIFFPFELRMKCGMCLEFLFPILILRYSFISSYRTGGTPVSFFIEISFLFVNLT